MKVGVLQEAPAVSVVIAAYNGSSVIGEQLQALAHEVVPGGFEVIVADNGSGDSTLTAVRRFADCLDLHIVDASARRGQAFARNRGAAQARGPLLLFLDQDDVIAPGYLASMAEALGNSALVAAGMDTKVLNRGWVASARSVAQTTGLPVDFGVAWGYGCTLGVRKSVFDGVGGFDETLRPAGEDVELCIRLAEAGHTVQFNPAATLRYRFPGTLIGLLRQGRNYGRGHINVCLRRRQPIPPAELFGWVTGCVAAATWMLPLRPMERRGQGAFACGRRLGLIEGCVLSGAASRSLRRSVHGILAGRRRSGG